MLHSITSPQRAPPNTHQQRAVSTWTARFADAHAPMCCVLLRAACLLVVAMLSCGVRLCVCFGARQESPLVVVVVDVALASRACLSGFGQNLCKHVITNPSETVNRFVELQPQRHCLHPTQ